MAQNIFEIPEVQDALRDLDSLSVPSLASPDYPNAKFVPPSVLRRFDSKKIYDILRSIPSTKDAARRLAREIVTSECVSVFLILLRMGQPAMIDHFMRFDTGDQRLPLEKPGDFPPALSFHDFAQHQQPFCAPKIRPGDRTYLNDRILPLTGRKDLVKDGIAKIFKIEIHPEFDALESEARVIDPHIYVAKVYLPHEDEAYQNELDAYARIRETGKLDDSLLQYYGTFTYRGERTVLLEYANGGTWEDFMRRPQPVRMEDRIHIWTGLLGLLKAIHRIHLASGWHQDVNPNNIVLHMPDGVVRWPRVAKLVDLGHSFFANGDDTQLGRERFGTQDYGAPECYRSPNDGFELGTRRLVFDSIDVFSLGGVLLEAAVWISDGPTGVQQFRDARRVEAKEAGMEEGIMCFHDGSYLLRCVRTRLNSLGQADGLHDTLTAKICRNLIPGMIHANCKSRSDAESLWKKAASILNSAQKAIDSLHHSTGRLHLFNVESESANGSSLLRIPGKSVQTAESDSQSEDSDDERRVLMNPPRKMPDSGPSESVGSPKPKSGKVFTLVDDESTNNFLSGVPDFQSTQASVGPSLRQSQLGANTAPPNHSRQLNDIAPYNLRKSDSNQLNSRPMVYRSRPKPRPKMTLHQAGEYIEGRRELTRDELDLKRRLRNRDHSFILDNSLSTSSQWGDICSAFYILASLVQNDDLDGIELRFTTSEKSQKSRSAAELYRSATLAKPGHGSSVEAALEKAIDQHITLLEKDTTRLLSIYILTDGNWDHGEPEAPLLGLVARLEDLRLNGSSLGIQFISFGDNKTGIERLQRLDDMHKGESFDLKLDIVDTVSCNGNVWEMLLGSIAFPLQVEDETYGAGARVTSNRIPAQSGTLERAKTPRMTAGRRRYFTLPEESPVNRFSGADIPRLAQSASGTAERGVRTMTGTSGVEGLVNSKSIPQTAPMAHVAPGSAQLPNATNDRVDLIVNEEGSKSRQGAVEFFQTFAPESRVGSTSDSRPRNTSIRSHATGRPTSAQKGLTEDLHSRESGPEIHDALDREKKIEKLPTTERPKECRHPQDLLLSRLGYFMRRHLSATRYGNGLLRSLRPRVRAGCQRIEWPSASGVPMYGDFPVGSASSRDDLRRLEARLRAAAMPVDRSSQAQGTRLGETWQSAQPSASLARVTIDRDSHNSPQVPIDVLPAAATRSIQPNPRLFFEFCVNTGPRRIELEEIMIRNENSHSPIQSDRLLFEKLNEVYFNKSFKTPYRWLRAPYDLHFVEFVATVPRKPRKLRVNVLDHPKALPRQCQEGVTERYDFLDLPEGNLPMTAESFLYYLILPRSEIKNEICDDQNIWLPRFAKKRYISIKTARGLEANVFEREWGIRVIEGPNYWVFILMAISFAIICLVVGLLVAWRLGDIYKGLGGAAAAFGIGSWTLKLVYDLMKDMDVKVKVS